eukprot:PhF_6_TR13778/c2_g1_i1/m.22183
MSDSDDSSIQFNAEQTPLASHFDHHSPRSHEGFLESSTSFHPVPSHRSASLHSVIHEVVSHHGSTTQHITQHRQSTTVLKATSVSAESISGAPQHTSNLLTD